MASDQVDKAGAKIGIDAWYGVPTNVDAAVVHPNGRAYFFKGSRYYRYNFSTDQVDTVADIGIDGWRGLDQWPSIVELNVASENRRAMVVDRWSNDPCETRPVVYYFHGNSGDIYDSYRRLGLHQLWPEAITVYAEGTDVNSSGKSDYNNAFAWQVRFPYKFEMGYTKDIEYVLALTRTMAERYPIAPGASFAAGHSSGGFFTLSMMDIVPHLFDGFAALGCHARYKVEIDKPARMLGNRARPLPLQSDEVAARPRPVLYMFGKNDESVGVDWPSSTPWRVPDASEDQQKQC